MTHQHKQDRSAMCFDQYLAGHQPRIIAEEILLELSRARRKFPEQNI